MNDDELERPKPCLKCNDTHQFKSNGWFRGSIIKVVMELEWSGFEGTLGSIGIRRYLHGLCDAFP